MNNHYKIDWEKSPLIPAIVQEYSTNEVLMLAFMNKEALKLTLSTKIAHYFSRSKNRIWKKGEESGNIQNVKEIFLDCDNDTILLKVEQVGGSACHTGKKSCFFTKLEEDGDVNILEERVFDPKERYDVIDLLYHEVMEKKHSNPEKSYTALLFSKGENHILKKVAEESAEFCFAIKDNNEDEIVYESADVIYHALVALALKNISPKRVGDEIKRRFGTSGIEEKKNRTK